MENTNFDESKRINPYDIEMMNKELLNGSRYKQEGYSIYDPYDLRNKFITGRDLVVILWKKGDFVE